MKHIKTTRFVWKRLSLSLSISFPIMPLIGLRWRRNVCVHSFRFARPHTRGQRDFADDTHSTLINTNARQNYFSDRPVEIIMDVLPKAIILVYVYRY